MKRTKKAISLALTAGLTCVLLTGQVWAAEGDAVWGDLETVSDEAAVVVETNTVVTDGVLEVTFDAEKLVYAGCDFLGENQEYAPYVAMYSVNEEQAADGVVKIAWVAPEAYQHSGDSDKLFQVNFQVNAAYEGTVEQGDVTISGSASAPSGAAVTVGEEPAAPAPEESPVPETTPAPGGDSSSSVAPAPDAGTNNAGQPATGDSSAAAVYAAVAAVCLAAAGGITVWNKRRAAK